MTRMRAFPDCKGHFKSERQILPNYITRIHYNVIINYKIGITVRDREWRMGQVLCSLINYETTPPCTASSQYRDPPI